MGAKKLKQRYWITFLLEDLASGKIFQPGVLHLTIIPWFVADILEQEVVKIFRSSFLDSPKIDAKIGSLSDFGPNDEVAVNLIENDSDLFKIHEQALELFNKINARWAVKNPYVGDDFKPHIRRRSEVADIKQGDILHLKSLSLIKANRQEDNIRTVAAVIDLK
jgi:2'-5' RNA ligase